MLVDKLYLVILVSFLHELYSLVSRKLKTLQSIALFCKLLHLSLYLFKVSRSKRLFYLEIIVEACVCSRTSCKLCLRIKIFYSLRHKVRSRVPESFLACLCVKSHDFKMAVMVNDSSHVENFAVQLYAAGSLVKSHADILDYLACRHCLFDLTDRAVF